MGRVDSVSGPSQVIVQDTCTNKADWNFSVSMTCLAISPRLRMDIGTMEMIAILDKKTFEKDQQASDSR